jgi:hypothetical protein
LLLLLLFEWKEREQTYRQMAKEETKIEKEKEENT